VVTTVAFGRVSAKTWNAAWSPETITPAIKRPAPPPSGMSIEQYHHERRQPGDKIARLNKELERFQHRFLIPVTLKTL
jgi:hypothetical protein